MVPFDVVAGGDCAISNSGDVTHLLKGFKMLDLVTLSISAKNKKKIVSQCTCNIITIIITLNYSYSIYNNAKMSTRMPKIVFLRLRKI